MKWKISHILIIVLLLTGQSVIAQGSPDDIKNKIEERNNQIKQLEAEIEIYNKEVLNASNQAKTLQSTIKTLDVTKKKIDTDINLTQNKIVKTEYTIQDLGNEIIKTEDNIDLNKRAVISAIRKMNELEGVGIIEMILVNRSISDIWGELDSVKQVEETIRDKSKELTVLKEALEKRRQDLGYQKNTLVDLKEDLSGKKQAVEYTVKEKSTLLVQTKNKEETFKELVKTKEELKEQFEREVYEYESQLHYLIDKNSYPPPRNGVLSWPLDYVYLTQRFGKTVGAEKLYTSGSHNGVDFRASIGTKVKNVLEGTVVGTGNTDAYKGCYSFGKWVMVQHDNGLSTIYAHLSVISVSQGQRLSTGALIGYSGNTGYSTGPHLHLGVYATQGVRIEKYANSRGCKEVVMPLADIKAYLDPLDYLPKI